MGNKVAIFSEEQLEDYQDCTFLTRKEILRVYELFQTMADEGIVPKPMSPEDANNVKLPLSSLAKLPQFKENPFTDRIAHVFTSQEPGSEEGISFNEFLEMMSVFSEEASADLKIFYAFKIYDFDDDGYIGIEDLEKLCRTLVKDGLEDHEIATICQKVLAESDMDGDGALSDFEFKYVASRCADFMSTFLVRI